ncbi:unnamed protein product [Orchesella dallaii]|uniref:G-protein coupled receptors family 1 profile domain-containing protein n=1 Tax=Orchesella dallaii TaxID=48710 RepID=A0ABP1PJ97_9HEXA
MNLSEANGDYIMENFLNESTNQPTMTSIEHLELQNESLPIDMTFNNGNVLSISVYTILFILSSGGNITVLTAILRQKRTESLSRIDFLLLHLAIADLMVTFFMMPLEIDITRHITVPVQSLLPNVDFLDASNISLNDIDPVSKLILTQLQSIKSEVSKIGDVSKKQDDLNTKLDKNITANNSRLNKLETENKVLHSRVNQLSRDNESLQRAQEVLERELKKCNIIIHGIDDHEHESNDKLRHDTAKLLNDINGKQIPFYTIYRIGQFIPERIRPVRVKLFAHGDRELIMKNRDKLPENKYINEDLPYTTRRDNAELRNKRKELERSGESATIDWNRKVVHTRTATFGIKDGKIHPIQDTMTPPTDRIHDTDEREPAAKRIRKSNLDHRLTTTQPGTSGQRRPFLASTQHQMPPNLTPYK